jgi:hypothetical protein
LRCASSDATISIVNHPIPAFEEMGVEERIALVQDVLAIFHTNRDREIWPGRSK